MWVLVAPKSRQKHCKRKSSFKQHRFHKLKRRHLGGNHKKCRPIWAILCCSGLRYATDSTFLKVVITIFMHLSFQPQKKVCIPGLCSKKAVPFTPANQKTQATHQKKTHKLSKSRSPFSKRPSPRKTTRKKQYNFCKKNRHLWRKSIATEIFQYFPITWNLDLPPQAVRNFFNSKETTLERSSPR